MGCCCLFLLASFVQSIVFGKLQLVEQQVEWRGTPWGGVLRHAAVWQGRTWWNGTAVWHGVDVQEF